jgi:hypothetical protein
MALEFTGRPEEPFLLRLATAMDELALIESNGTGRISERSPLSR